MPIRRLLLKTCALPLPPWRDRLGAAPEDPWQQAEEIVGEKNRLDNVRGLRMTGVKINGESAS